MVAAVIAYVASKDRWFMDVMTSIVRAAPLVPARRWSSASSYPELSELYYFFVWPSFFAVLGAVILKIGNPPNKFGSDFTVTRRVKALVASLLLLGFSFLVFASAHGGDIRAFPFGTSFQTLLLFGWFNFALTGVLSGLAIVGLVQCVTYRKNDF